MARLDVVFVWAEISHPDAGRARRAGWLTPYTAELITDDALHAGPGAALEVTVEGECDDAALACVQDRFARLRRRGLLVDVHRCLPPSATPRPYRAEGRAA